MPFAGQVLQCPECGEVIGSHGVALCASCGRAFHLDCLDLDTQFCLSCELAIAVSADGPGQQGSSTSRDEAE